MSCWDFLKLAVLVFSSTGGLKVQCLDLFSAIEHLTFNYLFYIKIDGGSQKSLYSPLLAIVPYSIQKQKVRQK